MFKYAELYGGKVRDVQESALSINDFKSIFSPTSYWIDVTGVEEVGIGWIIKFREETGVYFEAPAPEPEPKLCIEQKREAKLNLLNTLFERENKNAYLDSSLGIRVNAGDKAYRDVSGLIILLESSEEETVNFCDYTNVMRELSLEQLKTIQKEIILSGSYMYEQKWAIRDQITSAKTPEEIDAVIINFSYARFD